MFKLLLFICFVGLSVIASAQVESSSELYKTILSKDSLLFNIGFNTCDIAQFDSLLSEDFEFFHDTDSISNRKEFLNGIASSLMIFPPCLFLK